MSVLYNEFSILSVVPDLANKRVIINTNFKVDASTVNYDTVAYYDYDKGQLAEYSLSAEGKAIYINLRDYPANGSRYYLKISKIHDALGRELNFAYGNYVKFVNDVSTKVEILAPAFREAFTQKLIEIRLKLEEPQEDLLYRIEISSDNVFYKKITTVLCKLPNEYLNLNQDTKFVLSNKEVSIESSDIKLEYSNGYAYNNELSLSTEVDYNGQLYIRARAESSESSVGEWSELSSFTIYSTDYESMDTSFLENSIITHDLFDDNMMNPLEITDISKITKAEKSAFYIEFNKEILIPEDAVSEDGYINLGTIIGFKKGLALKERSKFYLFVDEYDPTTLIIRPIDREDVRPGNVYAFNIKNIEFEDGSIYNGKQEFITEPEDYFYVSIQDVKKSVYGLNLPEESIMRHIVESGKSAKYWATKHIADKNDIPDFNSPTFSEDYYPFYQFIKYNAIVEALTEFYISAISNPKKWKDTLSDLGREEEMDFDSIKDLIDSMKKEAEDWLELVVVITADPKWALRGKYTYSTYQTYSQPYHTFNWYTGKDGYKRF